MLLYVSPAVNWKPLPAPGLIRLSPISNAPGGTFKKKNKKFFLFFCYFRQCTAENKQVITFYTSHLKCACR